MTKNEQTDVGSEAGGNGQVCAIIIAYDSCLAHLEKILSVVASECTIIVADNSEDPKKAKKIEQCVLASHGTYIGMRGNAGIAAAQNMAIRVALEMETNFLLLLDDDCLPQPGMVAILLGCAIKFQNRAVVSAVALDDRKVDVSNVRGTKGTLVACRDLTSSGTLIPKVIFEQVGFFDQSLFVDGVDFDWGWRALALGIPLYITRDTYIGHRRGEYSIAGCIPVPAPIRHYYQFRNMPVLMFRTHTPVAWRCTRIIKLPVKIILIALLMPRRVERLRYALAGLRDAICGFSGKIGPL